VDAGVAVTLKISKGPEVATYSYSGSVTKPTDSGYTDGTVVAVKLLGSDGTELWKQSSVTSFPVSINLSGIKGITSGKVVLTYNVTVYTVDTNTGLSTTSTKEVSESRDVTFTKE
jgi:serine/threonine-protein kinase